MMVLIIIVLGFLLVRFAVVWINVFTRPVYGRKINLTGLSNDEQPKVSVLIPARNEEENLPGLFIQLQKLTYPNLEILVLDDQSSDHTREIILNAAAGDNRIGLIKGEALPVGWLGKHRACYRLANQASGDYFLFLDADIATLKPGIIQAGLSEMRSRNLSLLSVFPDQVMQTTGEWLVVPLMHYMLLSLLPLWAIYRLPFPSMAAANGQFMLFDAKHYRRFQWHEKVRNIIVEDIAIMQEIKKARLKGMTFVAGGWVQCRMYRGLKDGLAGFSKNILSGFGDMVIGLAGFLFLIWFVWPLIIPGMDNSYLMAGIFMIAGIRIGISLLSGQKISLNLLLHPLQMACLVIIGCWSVYRKYSGKNEWKGRTIS